MKLMCSSRSALVTLLKLIPTMRDFSAFARLSPSNCVTLFRGTNNVNIITNYLISRHLSPQLAELQSVIGRMMKEELATLVQREFGSKSDEPGGIIHEVR